MASLSHKLPIAFTQVLHESPLKVKLYYILEDLKKETKGSSLLFFTPLSLMHSSFQAPLLGSYFFFLAASSGISLFLKYFVT